MFLDPSKLKPIRLVPATVQFVADELAPNRASALYPFLHAPNVQKSPAELDLVGIPYGAHAASAPVSPKGRAYREALETLAKPELTLTLSELGREGPLFVRLVLGSDRCVVADADEKGLTLSPPIPYSDLIKVLASRYQNAPLQLEEQQSLWPSQLRTLTSMFTTEKNALEPTVSAAELLKRFERAKVDRAVAKAGTDELVASGFVVAQPGGGYALSDLVAFWLTRMGSGEIAELLFTNHDAEGNSAAASSQVRFVGAPKDRVTMLSLNQEEIRAGGVEPQEPVLVVFRVFDKIGLLSLFESLLGIAP